MAEDIRQNIDLSATAVTITLTSLANNAIATSNAIDLGASVTGGVALPFALSLEVILTGSAAGNTGNVEIYAKWSEDNSKFDDDLNDMLVGVVTMNGTAEVVKVRAIPVEAQYLKLRVRNASGAALAAGGNSLSYRAVAVDQA